MNKTQMAVIAGIVLAVIVGCIAGGVKKIRRKL